jgi:hypothetical protein
MGSRAPLVNFDPSEETPVTVDEVRSELEAICGSSTFRRAKRLQRFLRYICDRTLNGEAAQINEYLIGSEVFDRATNYSPHEDSVVRRQAYSLRQKLDEYYSHEGKRDSIRIEVPVGHYVPVFSRHLAAASDGEPQALSPASPPSRPRQLAQYALAVAGLLVVFWTGRLSVGNAPDSPGRITPPPAVSEIWGPWFESETAPVVCFSNPMTTVIKHFDALLPPGAQPPRVLAEGEFDRLFRDYFNLHPEGFLYVYPSIAQGKMGEAVAAVHMASLFARYSHGVLTTQSRFLSWEDFTKSNIILLGHNEANQWLDPILQKFPLRLAPTRGEEPRRILNTKPRDGEPTEFRIDYAEDGKDSTYEYALVSMLPGLDQRHHLALICGLNTQATQFGSEFLTDPDTLAELVQMLRKSAPNHQGPWYFQFVLRTEVRDKVPTGGKLELLKVLP